MIALTLALLIAPATFTVTPGQAEAREDWDVDLWDDVMNPEEREHRAIMKQHRAAGWVFGIGIPVGLITASVGAVVWLSNFCILGCDEGARANREIGQGLVIAGGIAALGSALIGGLMLGNANQKLRDLGRLEVSVAPVSGGVVGGARLVF